MSTFANALKSPVGLQRTISNVRRSAVTLIEVLVAIFVMGIGLLSLLTLFPLGALRMQKAIQDDRCAQMAGNARTVSVLNDIPHDPGVIPAYTTLATVTKTYTAKSDFPSFPVLVDPIGWNASPPPPAPLVTPSPVAVAWGGSFLNRANVGFVGANKIQAYQWFTLSDDIEFENGLPNVAPSQPGTPRLILPGTLSRDSRYSWALLCQCPRSGDLTVVDTAVVVYNKRSVFPGNNNVSLPEYFYSAQFDVSTNTVTAKWQPNLVPPPPLRVGDWILDNTPQVDVNGPYTAHAYFYRVVGLTELPSLGGFDQLEIEVETPLRGFPPFSPPGPQVYQGFMIVLDGVAEVYSTGTQRLP